MLAEDTLPRFTSLILARARSPLLSISLVLNLLDFTGISSCEICEL